MPCLQTAKAGTSCTTSCGSSGEDRGRVPRRCLPDARAARAHPALESPSELLGLLPRLGTGDHGFPVAARVVLVCLQAERKLLRVGVRVARDAYERASLHFRSPLVFDRPKRSSTEKSGK